MRRPTTRLLPVLLALATVLGACDDGDATILSPDDGVAPATGGIRAGNVAVAPVAGGLTLGNNTTRRVHYTVMSRDFAALALWGPCTSEQPACPTLEPGARRTLRAADMAGVDATHRDVIVYWWHPVAGRDGRLQADSIRAVVTRIGD